MDFYRICVKEKKDGPPELYPDWIVGRSKDLMVRGRSFYAIWDEVNSLIKFQTIRHNSLSETVHELNTTNLFIPFLTVNMYKYKNKLTVKKGMKRFVARRSRIIRNNIDVDGGMIKCEVYDQIRSEERRVGKECASMCRSRWSPYH